MDRKKEINKETNKDTGNPEVFSENKTPDFSGHSIETRERERKPIYLVLSAVLIIIALIFFFFGKLKKGQVEEFESFSFPANDSVSGILEESGSMKSSKDKDWWLNSGGLMKTEKGEFMTNMGDLQKNNKWRKLYSKNNPNDTDDGIHPQNIFRLVAKRKYLNFSQEAYFNIAGTNMSESKNRSGSNGIFFFNRYLDGDNLYYAGFRVDGKAVIKKKVEGKYYTMGEKAIFKNSKVYDRFSNPNLIPSDKWIGMKSEIENRGKSVVIKIFIDEEGSGNWKLALEEKDSGNNYGKSSIFSKGYVGIRTDFMDVSFRNYSVREIGGD